MDIYEAIRQRRSVRNYKPEPVPEDVLKRILQAVRLAPSGANLQPFKLILVRDKATRAKLALACRCYPGRPGGRPFVAEAPLVIVACVLEAEAVMRYYHDGLPIMVKGKPVEELDEDPDGYLNLASIDVAIALDHLTLAAVAEGLGTCWIAAIDAYEVKNIIGVPNEACVIAVMTVGYPISWPDIKERKLLDRIVRYESWD